MLTQLEQDEIMHLAQTLVASTVRHNRMVQKNETTPRIARAYIKEAEDRLRDYLKEAG